MRIGIDATDLGTAGGSRGGVYQYARQLLRQLVRRAPEHEYRLLFGLASPRHRREIRAAVASAAAPRCRAVRSRIPIRWIRRVGLPVELWVGRVDVFHAPSHLAPCVRRGAAVVSVHDLSYRRGLAAAIPAGLDAEGRRAWEKRRRFFGELEAGMVRSLGGVARVIASSHATANALVEELGMAADRIRVVHLAARDEVVPVRDPARLARVRERYGLPRCYGFYLGTLDPHKNLEVLLHGFALHRARAADAELALAGASCWYRPVLERLAARLGIAARVRFLGRVPDADLGALFSGARWSAMPSPLEGFGIPALEAMACGSPLIAARGGALPEVVDDAAVLVEPHSAVAFADAMDRLHGDDALRESRVRTGLARAGEFSWEKTAGETLRVYAEASGLCGSGGAAGALP
jgi:glycosyltransferase involved in cell wall biosynthesis